jgi:hypothetical protein
LLSFTKYRLERWKSPVEKEIDFYFKLNRFGRQILDNVHSSLWPILLGRMTSEPKDAWMRYFSFFASIFLITVVEEEINNHRHRIEQCNHNIWNNRRDPSSAPGWTSAAWRVVVSRDSFHGIIRSTSSPCCLFHVSSQHYYQCFVSASLCMPFFC